MAPGLYNIPLRSSSSSRARLPAPHASCSSSSSRHRQVAGAAPTSTLAPLPFPAFHTSSRSIIVPAAATASAHPKNVNTEGAARFHANASFNYSSSGSLHLHAHDHDPSSVCLAAMVHQFLEEEEKEEEELANLSPAGNSACGRARCNCVDGVCGDELRAIVDEEEDVDESISAEVEILQGYTTCSSKSERGLLMEVEKAIEELMMQAGDVGAAVKDDGRDGFRRLVMRHLRNSGYNAAACKSRWSHGDGLPAGDYEYIDVLLEAASTQDQIPALRLIVDVNFRAQFEIARPSPEYMRLLEAVPRVFVGRAEKVKQVVRMMSQAAKRSLRARGLLVPPWRKQRYMQAKWLSPIYRRTTNMEPSMKPRKRDEGDDMFMAGKGYRERHNVNIWHEEVDVLYRTRPLHNLEKRRDVCTAMCTSWQLPPLLEERSFRVSALSIALQNDGNRALNQAVSVVS